MTRPPLRVPEPPFPRPSAARRLLPMLALMIMALLWLTFYGDIDLSSLNKPVTPEVPVERLGRPLDDSDSLTPVDRGAYLARAGNCAHCHTAPGGTPYAGGRAVVTPFGDVYAGNLTPDRKTGIGSWSADDFWRAMHQGRSRDGRLLYPAFPYPAFTGIRREDSDALFAYLMQLPPVEQTNRAHTLRWPYSTQAALQVWQWLYFSPAPWTPEPQRSAEWNRGAYLVQTLAHCGSCHTPRNRFGATNEGRAFAGALMPDGLWYAPSLRSIDEAGVQQWSVDDVARLLRSGRATRGTAQGPMAEVVLHSTQHLSDTDLVAMGQYLKSLSVLPATDDAVALAPRAPDARLMQSGAAIYEKHCADCHGKQGEGMAGAFPALAGQRAVLMENSHNLLQSLLYGGYGASTRTAPLPHGMPPFMLTLNDIEAAAVLTYIRNAWGNAAPEVTPLDVQRQRDAAIR